MRKEKKLGVRKSCIQFLHIYINQAFSNGFGKRSLFFFLRLCFLYIYFGNFNQFLETKTTWVANPSGFCFVPWLEGRSLYYEREK